MPGRRLSAREVARSAWGALPRYAVVLWVVAALAGMLVPLPAGLVDVLLTLNLAGSLALLVASLQARRSTELLEFPRWLLLLTLSRLALNVSTTRLILTRADAGSVVDSFASLVIGGELLVGAAIFAILVVVQMVVVARGAERIAEVKARFALDGLPGHQAAIEADLKAGAITADEAARRRAQLHVRSEFHGRMDGAARWVRGDAVVAAIIVAVNLVGGTATGIREGIGAGEALALYGRLTIGDGLVTLVPALLVGLAAAVLVARAERDDGEGGVSWPGVLAAAAGLLAGLAMVPGMPRAAFAGVAVALFVAAGLAWARGGREEERRIVVWLSGHAPGDISALRRPLAEVRRRCAAALAIEVPEIVARGGEAVERVAEPDARGRAQGPVVRLGGRVLAVPEGMPERTWSMGQADATVVAVYRAVMHHAELLVDLQGVVAAIEAERERRPEVVRAALRAAGPAEVLEVVRELLRERVPAPPMGALLEAIASEPVLRQEGERGRRRAALRERLAGYFVREVVAARGRLGPVTWARPRPDAEAALLGALVAGEAGARLKLTAGARRSWWSQVLGSAPPGAPPIVVCSSRGRAAFALLLRRAAPHVPVLAAAELQAVELPVPGEPGGPPAAWFDAPPEGGARGLTRAGVAGEAAAA